MINSIVNQSQLEKVSTEQQKIVESWKNLYTGSGDAIEWIKKVREGSKRVNSEADGLIIKLRRARNLSKSLSNATIQPMTVGFFGLSQAGKSYLISSLAASKETGKLATVLGDHALDFISHINPVGGGKEATGLVTRFSYGQSDAPKEYPVELSIFNEIEIAKILANAFFNDFNQQKIKTEFSESEIQTLLQNMMKRKQVNPIPGVDSDDVVSLWDYMIRLAEKSQNQFKVTYWPVVIDLAPYLSTDDRAELFSLLWGGITELTQTYRQFAKTISQLKGARKVYAPLSTLIVQEGDRFSQKDSIMNVDMLDRLSGKNDFNVNVLSIDNPGTPISISIAMLAALTVELYIPLSDRTSEPLFETVDLLDFPGYRGRLSLESMEHTAATENEGDLISQLFLRGKVAYLFERYTDNQEMNTLIMCTASAKQSDVTAVGPVLDDWIKRTQGEDSQARSVRKPGLLWAMTMFDMRIANSIPLEPHQIEASWGAQGMMKMAMLERFGTYDWLQNWDGKAFNNTFLVRKPRLDSFATILLEDNSEARFNPAHEGKLSVMRESFIADDVVQKHFSNPTEAWDAMIKLNDGGMGRMIETLRVTALMPTKLARITEQLEQMRHELVESRLAHWYHADGAADHQLKQLIAKELGEALNKQARRHGELLKALMPEKSVLEQLYLQDYSNLLLTSGKGSEQKSDDVKVDEIDPFAVDNSFGDDFDLFAEPVSQVTIVEQSSDVKQEAGVAEQDKLFTEALMREWFAHLRQLADKMDLLQSLGIPKNIMEKLSDELIAAAMRLKIEQQLLDKFKGTEQIGVRRERMVGRQVFRAMNHIGDFLAWLGFLDEDPSIRPRSRVAVGDEIFKLPVATHKILPEITDANEVLKLDTQPVPYTQKYVFDWLVGLMRMIEGNAGHTAGREIAAEDNERLGHIITMMKN